MILLIDNYDSFTYNIFQYLLKLEQDVEVYRNDKITVSEIKEKNPDYIIISPGPGTPDTAGVSLEVIKKFAGEIPILGVCLGHQCIGQAFGGKIVKADSIFHGKTSEISHDGKGVFCGMKDSFSATRYHSLVIERSSLPDDLEITAETSIGEIMGVRHRIYSVEGVQFHPESIGTKEGINIFKNFIFSQSKKIVIKAAIKKVMAGIDLTKDEAEKVMLEIASGQATNAQIASLLTAMSIKGESVSELTGFAKVMRDKASVITKKQGLEVVDTCGTGGDGSNTFNISTISAFVTAGAGVSVAKHGNRSVTSRCGSADVMESLGVNILRDAETMSNALNEIGITFLFAPRLHKSVKHAVPVRKELGVRTLFNIIGPLANPADADFQIIGVFSPDLTEKLAKVLINLGVKRAMVVHGLDGLDEISLCGKTKISEINDGWINNYIFDPKDYGFSYCIPEDLKGGDLKTNTEIAISILEGEKGPKRDIVVINSAAAIYISGNAKSFKEAINLANDSLDKGFALEKLDSLVKYSSK